MLTSGALAVALRNRQQDGDYLLNDGFAGTLAAGAVNNSWSADGRGIRGVIDGNSKLSIGSGVLNAATGGVGNFDPSLVYADTFPRTPGLLLLASVTLTGGRAQFGWGAGADLVAATINGNRRGCFDFNSTTLAVAPLTTGSITVGALVLSTAYTCALIQRNIGMMYFIKGGAFSNWTLLYIDAVGTSPLLNPFISALATTGVFTADYLRVPRLLYLPSPLLSDGFSASTSDGLGHAETSGLGSGGSGATWTGATWAVSGGVLKNTPTAGSDVLGNGDFATSSGWTADAGWAIGGGVATRTAQGGPSSLYKGAGTNGVWYSVPFTIVSITGGSLGPIFGAAAAFSVALTSSGSYVQARRAEGPFIGMGVLNASSGGVVDNVQFLPLTLSTLFRTASLSTADVFASVAITLTTGTQAGLVLNLDSTSSPANFVIAYHNGSQVFLDKCVAGTYTNLISVTATYVAGALLRVRKDGTAYRVYYNAVFIGTEQTISDAGIISNTLHGTFSTYDLNEFDNLTIYATGSGGEYAVLDAF